MPALREFFFGPWRAVTVLGLTQIIAWGALFYPPVLIMPLIAAERGWSLAFAMAGFSLGLVTNGVVASWIGAAIDRFGGHVVMAGGSVCGALGLVLVVVTSHPVSYFGSWMLLGVAMAANLYDPAFASLGRIFGAGARRAIVMVTLAGGFAATISWPLTQTMIGIAGWQGAYLLHAVLLVCVAAPLHAFALPRIPAHIEPKSAPGAPPPARFLPRNGPAFYLLALACTAYAFVPSGTLAHLIQIFGRHGMDPAVAILIASLWGPAQVGARLCEFLLAGQVHPLVTLRFAMGLMIAAFGMLTIFGISVPVATCFAIMFGAANGLFTIGRGAVPLVLFGPIGYGQLLGRIAKGFMPMQAVAPLIFAFMIEKTSDEAALALAGSFACVSLACLAAIRRPA